MGLLDFIISKRQEQNKTNTKSRILPKIETNDEKANVILEEEIKNFFPKEGVWYDNCFSRPSEVWRINLPCHLRDNAWMSQLLHKVLKDKRIYNLTSGNYPDNIINVYRNDAFILSVDNLGNIKERSYGYAFYGWEHY